MAITQNKLTPLLVVIAATLVGYVLYVKSTAKSAAVPSGASMSAVPQPGVDPASAPKSGGLFGGSALPPVRSADADTSAETMATVTASNKELRASIQKVIDDNEALKRQNADLRRNEDAIATRVRTQLQAEMASTQQAPAAGNPSAAPTAPGTTTPNLFDNGIEAATRMVNGIGGIPNPAMPQAAGGMPKGLGYEGQSGATNAASPATADAALTKVIAPLGYRMSGNGERGGHLERITLHQERAMANDVLLASTRQAAPAGKPEATPYFTIPENATLARSTAMTTLVGRVPIDGRVQDPMQFKLVVGRENLAASGQFVPDDIAGVVVSGIAVGDMSLSCTEGIVHSLTFVFEDGSIRTVSQRRNGASSGFGGSGGANGGGGIAGQSLASASKLGWLSDEFGNPCIPGKFVTNAPAYLTDVIGAKALSVAGEAYANAETTVTNGTSALGSATSTSVTGNKGRYVMGKVAGSGSDELVNWLMRRLNNSFDAVVVRAGTRVAIHIDQEIHIDKEPDARKLDYARGRAMLERQQGSRHGTD